MKRIFYALAGFVQHYSALRKVPRVSSAVEISPQSLLEQGIKVLVLDFDGVLTSHGEIEPSASVQEWLNNVTSGAYASYYEKQYS